MSSITVPIITQAQTRSVARLETAVPADVSRWFEALRTCPPEDVPAVIFANAEVRVLAGRYHGLLGPLAEWPLVAEVLLSTDAEIDLPAPRRLRGIVYALDVPVAVGKVLINPGQAAVLDDDSDTVVIAAGAAPARALIICGPFS